MVNELEQFYSGKRILVTGAGGYIGHNLVNALLPWPCRILRGTRGLAKLPELKHTRAAQVEDVKIDYQQAEGWESLLEGIDVVFFFAAQTSTYEANADPGRDYQSNVLPMLNLLRTCESGGANPTIVFAGTATQVGITEKIPVAEYGYDAPVTVYDIHKLFCEKYLFYYTGLDVVNGCSLRLANVFGPGKAAGAADRGILNQMIRRAVQGEAITVYRSGEKIRDYLYIDDVVDAFLLAAASKNATRGKYFNIGRGVGYRFNEIFRLVAERVERKTGQRPPIEQVPTPDGLSIIEERDYIADITRYSQATGWSPCVEVEAGIDSTIDYFLSLDA